MQESQVVFNPYKKFHNAWVPTQLLQADISEGAKLFYGLLRKYAGKDGRCFPKQKTLARAMHCTVREIQLRIKELKNIGVLRVARPSGHRKSASYEFLWKSILGPVQIELDDTNAPSPDIRTNVRIPSLYEAVQLSGSPFRDSSSRSSGEVENFEDPAKTLMPDQEQAGLSENGEAMAGKLARAGWKVLMLGNGGVREDDAIERLGTRRMIQEMAQSKRMNQRKSV